MRHHESRLTGRLLWVAVLAFCSMLFVPQKANAWGNDYLEKKTHYSVYTTGTDKIHFKIPIFSYSFFGSYMALPTSRISYKVEGQNEMLIANWVATPYGDNTNDENGKGAGEVKVVSGRGDIIITSTANGVDHQLIPDRWTWLQLQQYETEDYPVTFLEFDWYPPVTLDSLTFSINLYSDVCSNTVYTHIPESDIKDHTKWPSHDPRYSMSWTWPNFTGHNNSITPQLFDPYLYQLNENGLVGYGYAAVSYTVFDEPVSYTTSLDPQPKSLTSDERAGTMFVMTTDTVQEQFSANFTVWRNKTVGSTSVLHSTAVDIPPYHRPYDLEAIEETDSTGTFTGNNILRWRVLNPMLKDLVEGDYFEVQRAMQPDYSDAQQLDVIPMVRDSVGIYKFLDDSRETWTGNAAVRMDTVKTPVSYTAKGYILRDDQGNPQYELDLTIKDDKVVMPSVPVYYRVRRATSSVWDWDHEFAVSTEMRKLNFLAPLSATQEPYTKDRKFDENRKVNFRIRLENAQVSHILPAKADFELDYTIRQTLKATVPVKVMFTPRYVATVTNAKYNDFHVSILTPDGDWQTYETLITAPTTFNCEVGSRIYVYYYSLPKTTSSDRFRIVKHFDIRDAMNVRIADELGVEELYYIDEVYEQKGESSQNVEISDALRTYLIDSLYTEFAAQYTDVSYGRCMWDRSARLVLVRTVQETGQSMEKNIPQDSIRRQADGSWLATFSDVADQACTHYSYSVRIDQSKADLRLQNPELQLQPVPVNGPDLYFDEGAHIADFTASRGDARGEMKKGVMLSWTPTSQAVDRFVLERQVPFSDAAPDTIYTGTETSYFDETAVPNQHYFYTVTAQFNCNGKGTNNAASAEGWRSQYGEISGKVVLTDNSGMKGVSVALQENNTVIRTLTTDATGKFRFDSLAYNIATGTNYSVVPTHMYAQFDYNGASTASIGLSADEAVISGLDFVNTSCVRLTGRVLYKNSTVPVAGAMFRLNNDTIIRGDAPLKSGVDGNFEIIVPTGQPCRLQVFKPGHEFEGDGFLRVEDGSETFALTTPLDGVRFYDLTKVRLVGRVAGGNDQRDLPETFGLGKNNLGADLQLVLQLEGDNTAHFVHDPNDLTRDTMQQSIAGTNTVFEKKRIIIRPDQQTGEYQIDLFPVKYKVVQATARGYATLFAAGTGNEVVDLTNAPLHLIVDTLGEDTARYNAVYDRIYHNPVKVELVQNLYGLERKAFGEPEMEVSSFADKKEKIDLYRLDDDSLTYYTLGYPLFYANRKYQFKAKAYEEYYFNNDLSNDPDRVPQRGGTVIVRNGLHNAKDTLRYELDNKGVNNAIWLPVDNVDVENAGTDALRSVSVALETEGNVVETNAFQAFVVGTVVAGNTLRSTEANIQLLDVIRDPGGASSSTYIESGTTYNFGYTASSKMEAGLKLTPTWGINISNDIGIVTAPAGTGSYIGGTYTSSKEFHFDIPISHTTASGESYTYSVSTNDRIQTSSSQSPSGVGSNADIFLGVTESQLVGKARTISIIDDSTYMMRQPAIQAGTMQVLASGIGNNGTPYHLVTGEQIVLGSHLQNTFIYTQKYIMGTIIPQLAMDRQNLLMNFNDSAEAKAVANATGKPVYWYHETGNYLNDTLPEHACDMIIPDDNGVYTNEVEAIDHMLWQWAGLIVTNECEKVKARTNGQRIGTYSVSVNTSYSHSDTYSAQASYNEMPTNLLWDAERTGKKTATSFFGDVIKNAFFSKEWNDAAQFGKTAQEVLREDYYKRVQNPENGYAANVTKQKTPQEIGTVTNTCKFKMKFEPISSSSWDKRNSTAVTSTRKTGFTLAADPLGSITVSVFRAELDSVWDAMTEGIRDQVDQTYNDEILYGSYVFYTEAGATMCPHEDAEVTEYYNPGTPLGNGTAWVAKPELAADTYEVTNVDPNQRATFHVHLYNQGQVPTGTAADGSGFYLMLDGASNPDGARVFVNGAPLLQSQFYWILPGQPITQTIEVERGTVDDYELTLMMYVEGCFKTRTTMNLGVHFLPVSTDVAISMPRQNWVMNTLSAQDSVGYYLPVTIDGFNIRHKNFDHIEFQYKLATQSDDDWVNQCSFFADDSLYERASGSKAMIENGRITPFRFYGERDPMEQKYDLRAVSFCRYGSGYVTKTSPVISGTKDTRPPRVFGEPEPANSILGVGDNLKLRFNEAIAGNYLDEDNNFQILGVTNETGLTATTALHFDAQNHSVAQTKVERTILGKPFTVDMMIRPKSTGLMQLFSTRSEATKTGIDISLTADNRILVELKSPGTTYAPIQSKPLGEIKEFVRVLVVWDKDESEFRFYAGSLDMTDYDSRYYKCKWPAQLASTILTFGDGFTGDMLETRVWTKPLTVEEIAATSDHYLTGYERELTAYYRMNEGHGDMVKDYANAANLYLESCSWNKHEGYSIRLNKDERAQLNSSMLGRSMAYDASYMLWFRTSDNSAELANLFSAGRTDEKHGVQVGLESGKIVLCSDSLKWTGVTDYADGEWHHVVMTINRTLNNTALYVDGNLIQTFAATYTAGVQGAMFLGGNFQGNLDEFAAFEQALPKALVEAYDNIALVGDEMGLIGYLPFEEMKLNPNGVLELVFSLNDRRKYTDPQTGKVIEREEPLVIDIVIDGGLMGATSVADKTNNAPVADHGQLTKMNFDWAFNGDELLINLNMQDREINKQSVYVTVRDVEDLNGNPMRSPVTWVAFVDRNSLKWGDHLMSFTSTYGLTNDELQSEERTRYMYIINHSGKRHQYSIESLPDWLTVNRQQGSLDPTEETMLTFTYDLEMPVGVYTDLIYLTDENGLSEPLTVELIVEAFCPWGDVETASFDNSMSMRGQVFIESEDGGYYDSDENDVISVFCDGELVGKANNTFATRTGKSYVYLTIYGNAEMTGKLLSFKLWRASTGRIYTLKSSTIQRYQNNAMRGISPSEPILLTTTSGGSTQQIALQSGWNWISWNLAPVSEAPNSILTFEQGFMDGDIVKSPSGRQFSTFNVTDTTAGWVGTLANMDYQHMFMLRTSRELTLDVEGRILTDEQRAVTVYGKCWSSISYLLDEPISVPEALADYYDKASVGDVIKSKTQFSVFAESGKWEGSLQTMQPGQGYLLRRLSAGDVTMHYHPSASQYAPKRKVRAEETVFTNPQAETNMTMVAKVAHISPIRPISLISPIKVYVAGELAGIAQPQIVDGDTLYFVTVQSGQVGNLRFELGGETFVPILRESVGSSLRYTQDAHHGTVEEPVLLIPGADQKPLKIVDDGKLYILMPDGTRYDATGRRAIP